MAIRLMRSQNALALLSKHKQLIIVAIGVVAIASYMIPFASMFAIADASYGDWKKVKSDMKKVSHKDWFSKIFKDHFLKKFGFTKISDSFNTFKIANVDIDNKVKGGDINNIAYTGNDGTITPALISGGATAVNFGSTYTIVNNNVQVCVLVTTCANSGITTSISTTNNVQYSQFGGAGNSLGV
jgi:hypothetical protein